MTSGSAAKEKQLQLRGLVTASEEGTLGVRENLISGLGPVSVMSTDRYSHRQKEQALYRGEEAQWAQRVAGGCTHFFLKEGLIFSVPLTDLGYTEISESLDNTFLLLPGHCLGMALSNLYYNFDLQKFCKVRSLDQTECSKVCEYDKQTFVNYSVF